MRWPSSPGEPAIEALTLRIGEFLVELAAGDVDGFSE
jgi:hypothetical protein